jgi:diacylglycerol kinase family enzyme
MRSTSPGERPRGVTILANPYSGARDNPARIGALAAAMRAEGLEPFPIWSLDELFSAATEPDFAATQRAVVAAGGDGTFNCLINRPIPVPLAMYPLGNENLLARQFGYTSDPQWMARMIAAGKTQAIDLGRAGERRFGIVASAGFDGDTAHRLARWRERAGRLKRVRSLNYLRPIVESACLYRYPMLEIEADGQQICGALAMVFNLPQYANSLPLAPDALADDGLLDWLVFARPGSVPLMRYALQVWRGNHRGCEGVYFGRAKRIQINCQTPAPMEIDGEAAGFAPIEISVEPAAIEIFVP